MAIAGTPLTSVVVLQIQIADLAFCSANPKCEAPVPRRENGGFVGPLWRHKAAATSLYRICGGLERVSPLRQKRRQRQWQPECLPPSDWEIGQNLFGRISVGEAREYRPKSDARTFEDRLATADAWITNDAV